MGLRETISRWQHKRFGAKLRRAAIENPAKAALAAQERVKQLESEKRERLLFADLVSDRLSAQPSTTTPAAPEVTTPGAAASGTSTTVVIQSPPSDPAYPAPAKPERTGPGFVARLLSSVWRRVTGLLAELLSLAGTGLVVMYVYLILYSATGHWRGPIRNLSPAASQAAKLLINEIHRVI